MSKVVNVVVWTVAAIVTVAIEVVGLHRAIEVRDELIVAPSCPIPVAEAPPTPEPREPPEPDVAIHALSVRDDVVEIEAGGRRHRLAGYPPPRSAEHVAARLTTAVVGPRAQLIAVAGECHGDEVVPSCARAFVRLYRVEDGGHVRDLKTRWLSHDHLRRPLAISFDARGERLAVLVQAIWPNCMWDEEDVELYVYRLSDGARLAHRVLETDADDGRRGVTFHDDEVHVATDRAHGRTRIRIVPLPTPDPT